MESNMEPGLVIKRKSESNVEIRDGHWILLYKLGGAAAYITVALIIMAIITHIVWPSPTWSPGAAIDWFTRFHNNWLLGLLGLDLLIVIGLVLSVPVFLALYFSLRQAGEPIMLVAITIALIGTVLHLTSNTAFEMLMLSRGYAAATTEMQRTMFQSAGEAALASYYGTAFHVSYILGYTAKIMIGAVMLRSINYSKATAYVAILAGLFGLAFYLPEIGLIFSILSVVILAIWNAMVARSLLRLGLDTTRMKNETGII